ncbi:MAG TPA: hypothetical protein VHE35_36645 [Kofleriaceae bacterium]|nr:hypothetical protein [Kofleriaceae bacterium]
MLSFLAAVLAVASVAQPWNGRSQAEAGPGPKAAVATAPVAPATTCKDDLASTRAQLADAQAQIARMQAQIDQMSSAERTRLKRQQDQLGAPMIEKLH